MKNRAGAKHEGGDHGKARLRDIGTFLKEAGDAWATDNAPRLSASLAFYAVLSLIPFLIVVASVAARGFGQKAAQGQLIWEIQDLVGAAGATAIQALLKSAYKSSTAATVAGSITLAFGASAMIMELRDALNTIWKVPAAASFSSVAAFLRLVKERFYLFGLILGVGILLLASLALSALAGALSARMGLFLPFSPPLLHLLVFIASFIVITIVFAAVYKIVPDVQLSWKDVFIGACFTSLLFTIGKLAIGIYLSRVNYSSTYGAAGSLFVILAWVYYSAQLFFFGAEFTKVYAGKTRRLK